MTDVQSNINVNINTSGALANLKKLETQINQFQNAVASSNSSAAAQQAAVNRALLDGINATGLFTAKQISAVDSAAKFTTALEKNRLSLGEYTRFVSSQLPGLSRVFRKEFGTIEQVATSRVKAINSQYIALGKTVDGVTSAIKSTPTGLGKNFASDLAIATQRQQIFNKLIDDGSTKLLNWGKNTQWAGRQLMVGLSLPLAAFGAAASAAFMELDKASVSLKRVYGDLNTTTAEVNANADAMKSLGAEYTKYGIAVKDTIELSARVAATGATNEKLYSSTEQTLRFATLGQMDYNDAMDTTIALQTAFGISSSDLGTKVDYLNAVENQTILTMQDMSLAIPRVATVVKGLGGNVEDLTVMMTAMREGGVSAENAANALKSGLASMINPTKNATSFLSKLGINLQGIVETNKGDLIGTIITFGQELDKLSSFDRQRALEKTFGKYQYARMSALFDNMINKSSQASRAMDLAGTSAQDLGDIADKELKKISESTTVKFQASMEKLKLAIAPIGEAFLKVATPAIQMVTKLADAFNNLPDSVKNAIGVATVAIAGIGPVLLMGIGLMGNLVANIIKGVQWWRKLGARVRGDASAFSYMEKAELDALAATEALEGNTQSLTGKLNLQAGAVAALTAEYQRFSGVAGIASGVMGSFPGVRGAGAKPKLKMATGGIVPGTGRGDKVPALLEPGEMVVNRRASKQYAPIISAMNSGTLQGLQGGSQSDIERLVFAHGQAPTDISQELMRVIQSQVGSQTYLGRASRMQGLSNFGFLTPEKFNMGKMTGESAAKLFSDPALVDRTMLPMYQAIADEMYKGNIQAALNDPSVKSNVRGFADHIAKGLAVNGSKAIGDSDFYAITEKALSDQGYKFTGKTAAAQAKAVRKSRNTTTIAAYGPTLRDKGERVSIGRARQKAWFGSEGGVSYRSRKFTSKAAGIISSAFGKNVKAGMGIASPSKDAQDAVRQYVDGLEVGAAANAGDAAKAGKSTATAFTNQVRQTISQSAGKSALTPMWTAEEFQQRLISAGVPMSGGQPQSNRKDPAAVRQRALRIRRSGTMGRMSRGLGAAGGVIGAASMLPFMMQNEQGQFMGMDANALGMGMMGAGMAFNFAKIGSAGGMLAPLATLAGPLAALGLIATAAGVAIKIWREKVDGASRAASDLGANLGGTANALNTMAALKGIKTPAQRQAQVQLGISDKTMTESYGEFQNMIESDAGKKFIEDLKSATSADRIKKMSDYLQSAIAGGIMTVAEAKRFADIIGTNIGDAVVATVAKSSILGLGTGAKAYQGLAKERETQYAASKQASDLKAAIEAVNKIIEAYGPTTVPAPGGGTMDVYPQTIAAPGGRTGVNTGSRKVYPGASRGGRVPQDVPTYTDKNGTYYWIDAQGSPIRSNVPEGEAPTVEQTTGMPAAAAQGQLDYQSAAYTVGSSMQIIQDFANVAALAKEDLANEMLTRKEYNKIVKDAAQKQKEYTDNIYSAIVNSKDLDSTLQAVNRQLGDLGISAEDLTKIEEALGKWLSPDQKASFYSEIAAATSQGMGAGDIAAITKYVRGEGAGTVAAGVFADRTYAGQAYQLANLGMNVQSGMIPGLGQEDTQRTIDVAFNITQEGGSVAEYYQMIMSIPPEIRSTITTSFQGMEPAELLKYTQGFNELTALGSIDFTVSALIDENGEPITGKRLSDTLKTSSKALKDLKSEKKNVRKSAMITLMQQVIGPNGETLSKGDAAVAYQDMIKNTGLTEGQVVTLPADVISKLVSMQAEVTGIEQMVAALNLEGDALMASGQPEAAIIKYAQATQLQARAKELKASIKTTAKASYIASKKTPKDQQGGSGGGGKDDPFKTFKEGIVSQIKKYADLGASMKNLMSGKYDFMKILKANNGLDDQIRKAGLSPLLANELMGMDPADAQKVLGKLQGKGGKALRDRYEAAQIKGIMDESKMATVKAGYQQRATTELLGQGASAATIGAIAGDEKKTSAFITLLDKVKAGYTGAADAVKKYIGAINEQVQREAIASKVMERAQLQQENTDKIRFARQARTGGQSQEVIDYISNDSGLLAQYGEALKKDNGKPGAAVAAFYQGIRKEMDLTKQAAFETNPFSFLADQAGQFFDDIDAQFEALKVDLESVSDTSFFNKYGQTKEEVDQLIKKNEALISQYQEQVNEYQRMNDAEQRLIDAHEREKKQWQDKTDAAQKQVDAWQHSIDLYNKEVSNRNHQADLINHELELMSKTEDDINKTYENRMKALDDVAKINDRILQSQQSQLDLSQALSTGDIYAAAQAMQQMQDQQVQNSVEDTRNALTAAKDNQIASLTGASGQTRTQLESQLWNINQQNYQTSLKVYDLEDQIWSKNQEIYGWKLEIDKIDASIKDHTDKIWENNGKILDIQNNQIAPLTAQNSMWTDRLNTSKSQLEYDTGNLKVLGKTQAQWADTNKRVASHLRALEGAKNISDGIYGNWVNIAQAIADANSTAKKGLLSAQRGEMVKVLGVNAADYIDKETGVFDYKAFEAEIDAQKSGIVASALAQGVQANTTGVTGKASGGFISGTGNRDSVPAVLTPGEFVMRKASVNKYGASTFEKMNTGSFSMPRYNMNSLQPVQVSNNGNKTTVSSPVYNTYSVNVPVNQPGASADEIANKVMTKIKNIENGSIRRMNGYQPT